MSPWGSKLTQDDTMFAGLQSVENEGEAACWTTEIGDGGGSSPGRWGTTI